MRAQLSREIEGVLNDDPGATTREECYAAALRAVRAQLDLMAVTGDIAVSTRNSKAFVQDVVPRGLAAISRIVRDVLREPANG